MSALLSLALAPLFSYAIFQDAAPPAAPAPAGPAPAAPTGTPEAKAALAAAMKALTETGSYSFELKTEGSGGGGRGGRGGGGGGEGGGAGGGDPTPPPPAKIQFEKGLPMHMQRGDMQAFVLGDVIVYFDTEKQTWEKLDPNAMRGGRGGRGPGGGGGGEGGGAGGAGAGGAGGSGGGAAPTPPAGGAAGGTEPAPPTGGATPTPPTGGAAGGGDATPTPPSGSAAGEGGDRRGGGRSGFGRMRDLLGVARAQPPHLVLGDIESSASDVSQSDVDGKVILKGTLSKDAAEKIASAGFGGRGGFGGGGGGGDGPERESSGSFEATLDGQGQLVALVVDTKIKMSFGDRDFERTTKHSYTLADFGSVKIEVPETALIHFEF